MFGFLNTNLELVMMTNHKRPEKVGTITETCLIRSSCQSISLPMIEKRALLSINTLTSSCWTTSSNFPGCSTYSRWYCIPAQPLLRTPMRMSCGVGPEMRAWSRWTAVGVCDATKPNEIGFNLREERVCDETYQRQGCFS